MSHFTVVNAGFSRTIPGTRRREWRNVQGITVQLPECQLNSREFRDAIREAMPEWTLEGYCLAHEEDA